MDFTHRPRLCHIVGVVVQPCRQTYCNRSGAKAARRIRRGDVDLLLSKCIVTTESKKNGSCSTFESIRSRLHFPPTVCEFSIDPDTERIRSYSVAAPVRSCMFGRMRLMNGKRDWCERQCENNHSRPPDPHPGPAKSCVGIQYRWMRQS